MVCAEVASEPPRQKSRLASSFAVRLEFDAQGQVGLSVRLRLRHRNNHRDGGTQVRAPSPDSGCRDCAVWRSPPAQQPGSWALMA